MLKNKIKQYMWLRRRLSYYYTILTKLNDTSFRCYICSREIMFQHLGIRTIFRLTLLRLSDIFQFTLPLRLPLQLIHVIIFSIDTYCYTHKYSVKPQIESRQYDFIAWATFGLHRFMYSRRGSATNHLLWNSRNNLNQQKQDLSSCI